MKNLLTFIACILCAVSLSAQDQKKVKETVTLNDGTEISGYVAKQSDGSYLIENESGDMFYYTAAEIKEVKKFMAEYGKEKGYMGMVNVLLGSPMGVSIINGYRFSPQIYLGLETGLNATSLPYAIWDIYGETMHIPLNVYFQYVFSKKQKSMFIDTSIGMNILPLVDDDYYNGDMRCRDFPVGANFAVTFGIKNTIRQNQKLSMWYGLQAGLSSITQECADIFYKNSRKRTLISPQICAKVALSF